MLLFEKERNDSKDSEVMDSANSFISINCKGAHNVSPQSVWYTVCNYESSTRSQHDSMCVSVED